MASLGEVPWERALKEALNGRCGVSVSVAVLDITRDFHHL